MGGAALQVSARHQTQARDLLLCGYRNAEIAKELGVAERTVKSYMSKLFARHGITQKRNKRLALAAKCYQRSATPSTSTVHLSERQILVLELVAAGRSNQEIAEHFGTTLDMTKNGLTQIYDALGLWTRVELAMWYLEHYSGRNE